MIKDCVEIFDDGCSLLFYATNDGVEIQITYDEILNKERSKHFIFLSPVEVEFLIDRLSKLLAEGRRLGEIERKRDEEEYA